MRVPHSVLNGVLLALLGLVFVLCALVVAHKLFGWIGPVALVLGSVYYGWKETRNA